MIKNIVILALLGLFTWQHWQDTHDRRIILSYLQRPPVHEAYKPCPIFQSGMRNSRPSDSVESDLEQEQ